MKIIRHLKVPTGDILVVEGNKGKLEMLSLGDYGKDVNLKCDAMVNFGTEYPRDLVFTKWETT